MMRAPAGLLVVFTVVAAAPQPTLPPPTTLPTTQDYLNSQYLKCVEVDISEIEELWVGLKSTIDVDLTENIEHISFGLLKEDWDRLKLLETRVPDNSPLRRKLVNAFRLLISALYQTYKEENIPRVEPCGNIYNIFPPKITDTENTNVDPTSETVINEEDNEVAESKVRSSVLPYRSSVTPYGNEINNTISIVKSKSNVDTPDHNSVNQEEEPSSTWFSESTKPTPKYIGDYRSFSQLPKELPTTNLMTDFDGNTADCNTVQTNIEDNIATDDYTATKTTRSNETLQKIPEETKGNTTAGGDTTLTFPLKLSTLAPDESESKARASNIPIINESIYSCTPHTRVQQSTETSLEQGHEENLLENSSTYTPTEVTPNTDPYYTKDINKTNQPDSTIRSTEYPIYSSSPYPASNLPGFSCDKNKIDTVPSGPPGLPTDTTEFEKSSRADTPTFPHSSSTLTPEDNVISEEETEHERGETESVSTISENPDSIGIYTLDTERAQQSTETNLEQQPEENGQKNTSTPSTYPDTELTPGTHSTKDLNNITQPTSTISSTEYPKYSSSVYSSINLTNSSNTNNIHTVTSGPADLPTSTAFEERWRDDTATTPNNIYTPARGDGVNSIEETENGDGMPYDEIGSESIVSENPISIRIYTSAETSLDQVPEEDIRTHTSTHPATEPTPSTQPYFTKGITNLDQSNNTGGSTENPKYSTSTYSVINPTDLNTVKNEINVTPSSAESSTAAVEKNLILDNSLKNIYFTPPFTAQSIRTSLNKTVSESFISFNFVFPPRPEKTSTTTEVNQLKIFPKDSNGIISSSFQESRTSLLKKSGCKKKHTCVKVKNIKFYNPPESGIHIMPYNDFNTEEKLDSESDSWSSKLRTLRKKKYVER